MLSFKSLLGAVWVGICDLWNMGFDIINRKKFKFFNWWPFFVYNLQEANEQASAASSLGAEYISRHVARVQDPFELAISTYALVVKNRDDKINSLNRLNDMKRNSRCSIQLA